MNNDCAVTARKCLPIRMTSSFMLVASSLESLSADLNFSLPIPASDFKAVDQITVYRIA